VGLLLCLFLAGCETPVIDRAFIENAHSHPDHSAVIEHVRPVVARGVCAEYGPLATVVRHWRKPSSPESICQWISIHGLQTLGSDWLIHYAASQDLWACRSRGSIEDLADRVRCGVPVIVSLQSNALDLASRRQSVVVGYDDAAGLLLGLDGGRTAVPRPYSAIERAWRAQDHRMIVVCPPEEARWELTPAELTGRAQFYESKCRYEEAVRDYESALARGVSDARVHLGLGNAFRALSRMAEAEQAYRRAIAADAHLARAYNNLAYLLAEHSPSGDEAVALARQALVLDPSNALIMDTLGYSLCRQGRHKEAADMLERARARAKWFPPAMQIEVGLHLALAYHRGGQDHLARQVLSDLLALDARLRVPEEMAPLLKAARRRR
jgi:tetratricopeptide (TPR) repeat protein